VAHVIDPAGFVTSTSTPAGTSQYTYNAEGGLASVTDPAGRAFVVGYDSQGRQTSLVRPNGTTDASSYTDANQPVSLTTTGVGGGVLAKATDTIDPATGLVTKMTDLAGVSTYAYNPDGMLVGATHPASSGLAAETYSYDAAGNRITGPGTGVTSTYDPADRLLDDGTSAYTWNSEGDLATKTVKATGVKTTYSWNADGELLGTSDTAGSNVGYSYDPLGRLAAQTVNGATTRYLWDSETLISETTGTTTTSMVTEPTLGLGSVSDQTGNSAVTLETLTGSTSVSPIYDLHGDWIAGTGATGQLTQPVTEYSTFGTPSTAGTLPEGFDGYLASPNGLDYAYGRFYDPQTGRFLTQDPVTAPNPYSYSANSPVSYHDPSGLELEDYATTARVAVQVERSGTGEVSVYAANDSWGNCYVGITNSLRNRFYQHGSRFVGDTPATKLRVIAIIRGTFARDGARVIEQKVIERGGTRLAESEVEGPINSLLNVNNSIKDGGAMFGMMERSGVTFLTIDAALAAFSAACP
jgi:RHS repeat-associated protein